MKSNILFLLALFISGIVNGQVPSANSFSSYVPYTGKYSYGVNQGYYGANWNAQQVAVLASGSSSANVKGAGAKSFRVPLYDDHLTNYGLTAEVSKLQYYSSLGAGEFTAFVGSPHSSRRETATYPGSPEQAKTFKNLYEPIWLDAAQTQVNPNNYYAKYLYDVVNTYGPYIKFWEIVNEPDYTYSGSGWQGDMNPPQAGSWFDHDPTAEELVNLRAPIEHYVRMLRISWEVIKRLQPNDYVCTGGIGYRSFLDAVLRNTDNPVDGSVTSAYPLKGGAYFDVISFHCYPMYNIPKIWNNTTASVEMYRNSDEATLAFINVMKGMENVAIGYGYNSGTYPKKQFISTETGVSRIMNGGEWGSNEGQKNYMIKAQVASQKSAIDQVYWFQVGDGTNPNAQFDRMGLYYYFGGSVPYNATKSDQGIAMKTTSDLLYGKVYDAAKTASLNLSSSVDGGAFRAPDGSYVYVLWAKTKLDLSESASATYSFPSTAFAAANVVRREWNFSETNTSSTIPKTNISLNGTPSFFTEGGGTVTPTNQLPVVNAGTDQTITLPANSATLSGTATDTDGTIASYGWSQVSGPSTAGITSPANAQTLVSNLVQGTYAFELRATDNGSAIGRDTIQVIVNAAAPAGSTNFRVEAESFTAQNGVQTENTGDAAGGGKNVGWIDQNDWMDFSINPSTAGTYTVNFRVATPNNGAQFQLRKADGTVLATVTIPNTGAYQTYQTISASITLAVGVQTIRVVSTATQGWNFNWMEFANGSATPPPPPPATTTTKIESESYTSQSGVQTEGTWDAGGGLNVGWIDLNDWMDYSYNAPSTGAYTVKFRVATPNTGAQLQLRKPDGTVLATVNLPNTGGYQSYQTVSATVNLTAGIQTLRVTSSAAPGWNTNWMEFLSGASTTPSPAVSTFKVEAESYTAMNGIQTENTWDAGGGQNVGWIDLNDWMDFSINPSAAGSYTVKLRVATPNNGAKFQIRKADGTVLATVSVPNTGGYQAFQTVNATVTLAQGQQTIRIHSTASDGWNFNWMEFSGSGSTTTPTVTATTKMEAENFTAQSGVQTEGTWDVGGGQNVGWIDQNDWMDYSVSAASAGTYTVSFRVATPNNGAQFQLRKSDGTVLGTVNVPNTGAYQSFQTVPVSISLAAGTQTIRIVSTATAGWNFNWFEILQPSGAVTGAAIGSVEVEGTSLEVSPNPITDRFVLKVTNNLTGPMKVSIIDERNSVAKTFSLSKTTAGTMQTYLSIGSLTPGNYTLKVEMEGWTQSKQITKQ